MCEGVDVLLEKQLAYGQLLCRNEPFPLTLIDIECD